MNEPKWRLLVVDDDADVRADYQEALTELGYPIDSAAGGDAAREQLKTGDYAVAVIDMTMPDFTGKMSDFAGEELYRHIGEHYPATQAIILTSLPSIKRATRMSGQGAVYLSKLETDDSELLRVVSEAVLRAQDAKQRLARMPFPPSNEWGD